MGLSTDYSNVPEWVYKAEGYDPVRDKREIKVKYQGNIFKANYWAGKEPGVDPGWELYDELYDQTAHTPTEQAKIIAYIPTWKKQAGFNYSMDEMYRYITHGIISFLMFDENKLGEFTSQSLNDVNAIVADVVTVGHRNGVKVSIALGGATDYGFLHLMTAIGNNPGTPLLDQAVQKVVEFVQSNNLDGVDLDLECWWDANGNPRNDQGGRIGPHPAGHGLTAFAKRLREAMPNKLLSAAFFASSWYGNNYQLIDYVDWIGVMTYDLTGSWNNSPVGPHTALYKIRDQKAYEAEQQGPWPLPNPESTSSNPMRDNPIQSVEEALWYWTNPFYVNWQGAGQKMPRSKFVGGVPLYGYDFSYPKDLDDFSGQIPPGYKTITYKDILAQFPEASTAGNGNIKVLGNTLRPPFVSTSGNYPYAHNIYFETPETSVSKLNFLKNVGAQGVIIWELTTDVWGEGKSIIKSLYENSGNASKPSLDSSPELGNVGRQYLRLTEEDKRLVSLAKLVSQSNAVNEARLKEKIMKDVLKPAAFLAHLLGYGWCGGCRDGKAGYVGEDFVPIKEGAKEGWKAIYTQGCEGFMADQRLKIYFSNWSFLINKLNVGDIKNTEKKLMRSSTTPVDNSKGNAPLEQTVGGTEEVQTQVSTYNLTTQKWEVGVELGAELETPLNSFLGGAKVSFKVFAKGGQDKQTGIVTTTSDKSTLTNVVKATVQPRSRKDYRIDVYGTQSRSDNCSIEIEVRFELEFDGFLRWGGGKTPESNYHKEHRGSDARPKILYTFGSNGRSFSEDLKYQMEHPNDSVWDWELLLQDHRQDLEWATSQLTQNAGHIFNLNFGLEGVKGTSLEITSLN